MASTARSEFLRILREINGERMAVLFTTAGKSLIWAATIYLLLSPVADAGARLLDAFADQHRVIAEKFEADEWMIKEATDATAPATPSD